MTKYWARIVEAGSGKQVNLGPYLTRGKARLYGNEWIAENNLAGCCYYLFTEEE